MIRWIYLLIIFVPLPFGGARPIWQWFWLLYICLLSSVLALSAFYKLYNHGNNREPSSCIRVLSYYFGPSLFLLACSVVVAFLGRTVLQTQEFSLGHIYEQYNSYLPIFPVNSSAELGTISLFISHILALYCCAVILISNPEKVKKVTDLIGFVATAYACYGLIIYLGNFTSILWYEREHYSLALTSTFVNRNNFAQYAGIGILATLTGLLRSYRSSPNQNLVFWLLPQGLLRVGCLIVLITAQVLTLSRGGMVGTWAAISLWLYLIFRVKYLNITSQKLFLILGCGLTLSVFLYSGEGLIQRLANTDILGVRRELWSTSIKAILSAPYGGHGLGSFASIQNFYNKELHDYFYYRAHNEYLQFAVGVGIPAFVFFLIAYILCIYRIGLTVVREGSIEGVFGICLGLQIGIQAFIDFPLQIPAISYLFVIVLTLPTCSKPNKINR